jgi:hypothetical protein
MPMSFAERLALVLPMIGSSVSHFVTEKLDPVFEVAGSAIASGLAPVFTVERRPRIAMLVKLRDV